MNFFEPRSLNTTLSFSYRTSFASFATACALALSAVSPASADSVIADGDAAVTGLSGLIKRGASPDQTVLDANAPSLRILDLANLGGAPRGQLAPSSQKLGVPARDIGQVFGVVTVSDSDGRAPDVYVAATSLYGLQIVATDDNGKTVRLVRGAPGATWMDGQFGAKGGPGSIWKIDGTTGAASLFADVTHEGRANSGPGLGGLAYDTASRQIFVTDLETGLIHRFDLDGRERGTFDHGVDGRPAAGQTAVAHDIARRLDIESPAFSVENPATWGYAERRRMVFAVTTQGGRLYYSTVEGPQVWSVGINSDGSFAGDARRELEVAAGSARSVITAIQFDGPNRMLLAERGETTGSYDFTALAKPDTALVLAYRWNDADRAWSAEPDEFAIGLKAPHRSALGGLALGYGYDRNGRRDTSSCRQTLWTTGEHLRDTSSGDGLRAVHGLQGTAKDAAKPMIGTSATNASSALLRVDFANADISPNDAPDKAWFIDADGAYDDADAYGRVGSIAIASSCDPDAAAKTAPTPRTRTTGEVPVPAKPGVYIYKTCFPGLIGGKVRCRITVQNIGIAGLAAPVAFSDVTTVLGGPAAGTAATIASYASDGPGWSCSPTPTDAFGCSLDAAGLLTGKSRHVDVFVDTGPMASAGSLMFRNCASLAAPWSGIACDLAGAELELEKTLVGACVQGTDCTFSLTVTNTGKSAFAGTVRWTDGLDIAGPAVLPITSVTPAFGCAPEPASLPFSCPAPISLASGQSVSHLVTVAMPANPAGYKAKNCFAVTDPSLAPVNPVDPFGGGGLATPGVAACVDVDVLASNVMPVVHKPIAPKMCVPGHNEVRTGSGACVCKSGTVRLKGVCTPLIVPKPKHCPIGTTGQWPKCKPVEPKACPRGTVGKYPDCKPLPLPKCPDGMTGVWPVCKKVEDKTCPRGTIGKYPDCKPVVKPTCPDGTTGRWPLCKRKEDKSCPRGTIGKFPDCKPVVIEKCPSGKFGKFPNCRKLDIKVPDKRVETPKIEKQVDPVIRKPARDVPKLDKKIELKKPADKPRLNIHAINTPSAKLLRNR